MKKTQVGVLVGLGILIFGASAVSAQEFEPRTYSVAPVGLNFIGVGYGFASGGVFWTLRWLPKTSKATSIWLSPGTYAP